MGGASWTRRHGRRDAHVTPDANARLLSVGFLDEAADLDHRSFVSLDVLQRLLVAFETQVAPLGQVGAARLVLRASVDGEHASFCATGYRQPDRVLRHRLFLLLREEQARRCYGEERQDGQ